MNPLSNGKIVGTNIGLEVYCKQEAQRGDPSYVMSRGELMEFNRCPHRWIRGYKEESTKATDWGSLIDALLFDRNCDDRFSITPETYPDKKTGEAKKWNWNANYCKDWRDEKEASGKEVVKADEWIEANQSIMVLMEDEDIHELITCSDKQVMITADYHDEITGVVVPIKTLIDFRPSKDSRFSRCLADFKTGSSAGQHAWARAVFDHDYHVQAVLYLDADNAATKEGRDEFRHVIQESFHPWEVGKRIVSEEFIQIGRETYLRALQRYCQCLSSGIWPGYDDAGNEHQVVRDGWPLIQPLPFMINAA